MNSKYGFRVRAADMSHLPTFATSFQWLSFCVTSANDFQQVPPDIKNYKYT